MRSYPIFFCLVAVAAFCGSFWAFSDKSHRTGLSILSGSSQECRLAVSENPTYPINLVDPPAVAYCKGEDDVCPSIFLPLLRVWQELDRKFPGSMSHYALNVGARDGIEADPVFPLFENNPDFGGMLVEMSDEYFARLSKNFKDTYRNVELVHDGISPANAITLCKGSQKDPNRPYPSLRKSMDIFKFDIDGCECHILEIMLQDSFFHAKVIQLELNHHLPPPLIWKDMCYLDTPGRSNPGLDVWGCSMQAAYDIVQKHGYELLQYDWPDAVFVHHSFRAAFPCLLSRSPYENFVHNFWLGYTYASQHYRRWGDHQNNPTFVASLPALAAGSVLEPKSAVRTLVAACAKILRKRPLLVEVGVSGTLAANVTENDGEIVITYHDLYH